MLLNPWYLGKKSRAMMSVTDFALPATTPHSFTECDTAAYTVQERLPEFRPVMSAAFDGLYGLGRRALRLMALALDLPPTWFLDRFERPILTLRPLHYSATLSKPEEVSPEPCIAVLLVCRSTHHALQCTQVGWDPAHRGIIKTWSLLCRNIWIAD